MQRRLDKMEIAVVRMLVGKSDWTSEEDQVYSFAKAQVTKEPWAEFEVWALQSKLDFDQVNDDESEKEDHRFRSQQARS